MTRIQIYIRNDDVLKWLVIYNLVHGKQMTFIACEIKVIYIYIPSEN